MTLKHRGCFHITSELLQKLLNTVYIHRCFEVMVLITPGHNLLFNVLINTHAKKLSLQICFLQYFDNCIFIPQVSFVTLCD